MWYVAAVTGLFLLVMIAAAVQGPVTVRPAVDSPPPLPTATTVDAPEPTGTASPEPTPSPVAQLVGAVLVGVLAVLILVAVVALVVVLVRRIAEAWRDRPLRRRAGVVVDSVVVGASAAEPAAVTTVIQRGIAGALRQIHERPEPSDAIVAAWVGLEESAADAGLARGRSETPGEFTLRIITTRAGISADATALLRLFERVRFGGYAAVEADREAARAALRRIEEGWR